MSWFTDLAGKAETLLNNLDEQTGAALRNHNIKKPKHDLDDYPVHPDGNITQKKRVTRNPRKSPPISDVRPWSPTRKASPTHQSRAPVKDVPEKNGVRCRKSPLRKNQFDLNNCPRTLVDDVPGDHETIEHVGCRRRSSLPTELEPNTDWTIHAQNMEVENAMLKNELNVVNTEVSELIDKCRAAEDGNHVDRSRFEELNRTRIQLESSELQNHRVTLDKDSLACQLDMLKQRLNEVNELKQNYMDDKQRLAIENCALKDANHALEERLNELCKKIESSTMDQLKIESELRHAQTTISELQLNLDRSNQECQRLDKEWATYKLRVKSMLSAKDNEIKALQDGLNLTEDSKVLVEQLDRLKQEKEELSEAISTLRHECDHTKQYTLHLEAKWNASERVVAALRDTLQEERAARNRVEEQCINANRELKNLQAETNQTIAGLKTALRDKESEINNLRETSSLKTIDNSSLNVADYDMSQTIDNDKVQFLTESLVQKQARINRLLVDNNTLRIQLDKLEHKFKSESLSSHSVVTLHDNKTRRQNENIVNIISYRIASVIRRHPLIRVLVIVYMICLHFWVLTVLFTSTPTENYIPRSSKT